ncbi:MAG: hypothetical protein R3C56_21340 [Pirellulaceae bacterium]
MRSWPKQRRWIRFHIRAETRIVHPGTNATWDFNGLIGDALIYSRAYPANEIASLASGNISDTDNVAISVTGIVNGTTGNDTINVGYTDAEGDQVTSGNDRIHAGSGNDTIHGGDGDDTINADDVTVANMLTADPTLVYNAATGKFYKLVTARDVGRGKLAAVSVRSTCSVKPGGSCKSARRLKCLHSIARRWRHRLAGGQLTRTPRRFVWTDGSPISYQNFAAGQPDGVQHEDVADERRRDLGRCV